MSVKRPFVLWVRIGSDEYNWHSSFSTAQRAKARAERVLADGFLGLRLLKVTAVMVTDDRNGKALLERVAPGWKAPLSITRELLLSKRKRS